MAEGVSRVDVAPRALQAPTGSVRPPSPQTAPSTQKLGKLFDRIDVDGKGVVTRPQIEAAVSTGLYARLDPGGAGSVSKQGFIAILSGLLGGLRKPAEPPLEPETINQRLADLAEKSRAGAKLDLVV